jgi:hypothetical protein
MTEAKPKAKRKPKEKSPEPFKIRLLMNSGAERDILSPLNAAEFYREMAEMIREKSSQPEWDGWYQFKKSEDQVTVLQIIHVIGVEDI